MRKAIFILMLLFAFCAYGFKAAAQNAPSAFEQGQKLRSELGQLQDREAEIKIRLTELEYDLKPENIERHFAGVGSVHPEELREARRKQLQIEKDRLTGQLSQLDQNQARLETEIQLADSKAYQQSAMGASKLNLDLTQLAPFMTAKVLMVGAIGFGVIVLGIAWFAVRLKRRSIG